jgi:hypothetical protein
MTKAPAFNHGDPDSVGVIYGHDPSGVVPLGAKYEQNGCFYNSEFKFLARKAEGAPPAAEENAATDDEPPAKEPETEAAKTAVEEMDLKAWARGEKPEYAWFAVKAAIAKQLNVIVKTKQQAISTIEEPPQL